MTLALHQECRQREGKIEKSGSGSSRLRLEGNHGYTVATMSSSNSGNPELIFPGSEIKLLGAFRR